MNVSTHESLFQIAGFNGCIGSADATHVIMLNRSSWASLSHKGLKLNLPACSYNITVNHWKQILCSTNGHPSTWNNKTLVLFDPLLSAVHSGEMYQDYMFSLFEKNENGEIKEVLYKGVWFIVDNGYLSWPCTVPPLKDAATYESLCFSEWLESMQKDVECTFGILKTRFSILKYGIRLRSLNQCDNVWLTCCALHNMLLKIDGYDKNWTTGECQLNNENNDLTNNQTSQRPFAVSQLNDNLSG